MASLWLSKPDEVQRPRHGKQLEPDGDLLHGESMIIPSCDEEAGGERPRATASHQELPAFEHPYAESQTVGSHQGSNQPTGLSGGLPADGQPGAKWKSDSSKQDPRHPKCGDNGMFDGRGRPGAAYQNTHERPLFKDQVRGDDKTKFDGRGRPGVAYQNTHERPLFKDQVRSVEKNVPEEWERAVEENVADSPGRELRFKDQARRYNDVVQPAQPMPLRSPVEAHLVQENSRIPQGQRDESIYTAQAVVGAMVLNRRHVIAAVVLLVVIIAAAVVGLCGSGFCSKDSSEEVPISAAPAFENGNLEIGNANGPDSWIAGAWDLYGRKPVFEWNSTFGTNGSGGIMIQNDIPNDSHWAQMVSGLTPGTEYRVSAMIRLDSYSWVEDQGWEVGATLSRLDSYDISEPPINQASPGTWEPVELIFTAERVSETIGCRLGHWSSIVSGIMFCDDFKISTASTL